MFKNMESSLIETLFGFIECYEIRMMKGIDIVSS